MRKSTKSRKSRANVQDRSATTDIVSQLECAIHHPQATLIGAVIGGVVPWFARTLAHEEVPTAWANKNLSLAALLIAVIIGCAVFSALTVYKFGKAAFGDARKALGFVLAIEGVMLVSHGATSVAALVVLIAINAIANGSVIALSRQATCKQRDAARRASQTRASRQSRTESGIPAREPQKPVIVTESPRVPRRAPSRSRVKAPWNPMISDVIDAEIVSEQRLLA